jgi:hypothetical protein
MTRSAARVLALLGLAVAAAGILAGLLPISSGGESCGGGFWSTGAARDADLTASVGGRDGTAVAGCKDKRATVRLVVIPMIVAGGAVGAVAWIGRNDED